MYSKNEEEIFKILNSSIDGLQNQINMLDRRITKLESMVNSTSTFNTNFSDSNYHVM